VLEVAVTSGEYRTDTNGPVMTIADLTTVLVSSDVAERDIRLVQVGEGVSVELVAYPGQAFEGRVTRISDTVDARTRTVQVQADIANRQGRLRPEMYGRIRHSHVARPVPVVPQQALIQSAGGPFVFVERTLGSFERVAVVPGGTSGGTVAILEGLRAGDRVVVDGAMLLQTHQAGESR
jgi:cobalt-zinc-cadmium efflux system membrane fusion protein